MLASPMRIRQFYPARLPVTNLGHAAGGYQADHPVGGNEADLWQPAVIPKPKTLRPSTQLATMAPDGVEYATLTARRPVGDVGDLATNSRNGLCSEAFVTAPAVRIDCLIEW